MGRDCIICGNYAGSAEHIFPAALGGRRKNKSIYCDTHNTAYSGLVALLAQQLEPLNSLLEVKSDRTNEVRPAKSTEVGTGLPMSVVGGRAALTAPRIIREEPQADGSVMQQLSMLSKKEAWAKIDDMRDRGVLLHNEKPKRTARIAGQLRQGLELGSGDGLRAAGYILQTYLAQEFPDLARSAAMDDFKAYTLGKDSTPRVRWDFEKADAYPTNAFKFGHQVLVGVDPESGRIYGRLSFFSTISFVAEMGKVDLEKVPSMAVVIDIDPLAAGHPQDQSRTELAAGAFVPAELAEEGVQKAVQDGAMQQAFGRLIVKIEDHLRERQAQDIIDRLQAKNASSDADKEAVLSAIKGELVQRAFNLAGHILESVRLDPRVARFAPRFETLLRQDDTAIHGISDEGFQAVQDCASGLVEQLRKDWSRGQLVLDDVAMLIGGGRGAGIVGEVLFTKYAGLQIQ